MYDQVYMLIFFLLDQRRGVPVNPLRLVPSHIVKHHVTGKLVRSADILAKQKPSYERI